MSRFTGVYAALLTPRHNDGELDIAFFRHQIEALGAKGLQGYAINGATGEFTLVSEDELQQLLSEARSIAPQAELLCGIGAADARGAIRRGRLAAAAGAQAVLLPMPYFFPYRQDDLRSFVLSIASSIEVPVLLYNLPQFTSGMDPDTVLGLLSEEPKIVGIKDSSGSLEILRAITQAGLPASRLIGNDGALCDAIADRLCDGVVSGVACALPELMVSLFQGDRGSIQSSEQRRLLMEFIDRLAPLPTPWGLKVASAARGYTRESFPFPLSADRIRETERLREWFAGWYPQTLPR